MRGIKCFYSLKEWINSESGVTSIEYALVGVLIAVVIVGAVTFAGEELNNTYEYIAQCVDDWSCN